MSEPDGRRCTVLGRRVSRADPRPAHASDHARFLAYRGTGPIGPAPCFRGFPTFAARPLVNIHDLFVAPAGTP